MLNIFAMVINWVRSKLVFARKLRHLENLLNPPVVRFWSDFYLDHCTVWTEESVKHAAEGQEGRRALHHLPLSWLLLFCMPSMKTQDPVQVTSEEGDEYIHGFFGVG